MWLMSTFYSTLPVPFICSMYLPFYKALFYSFLCVFLFWAIQYIAVEIETPYGESLNHLPLPEINRSFNIALKTLLEDEAQMPPSIVETNAMEAEMKESVRYSCID